MACFRPAIGEPICSSFLEGKEKGGILIFFFIGPPSLSGPFPGGNGRARQAVWLLFWGTLQGVTGRLEPGSLRVRDRSVSFTLLYEGMRIPVLHLGTFLDLHGGPIRQKAAGTDRNVL